MRNRFIFVAGILLTIFVAAFFYNKYRIAPKITFNALVLTDLDGNSVSFDQFKDKKLFINFFATWCGPCLQEIPALERAQSILEKGNFKFLLISDEPTERLKMFSEQSRMRLVILHSEKKLQEQKIFTLPTTYILNLEHEIVFKKVGVDEWADAGMIEKLKAI